MKFLLSFTVSFLFVIDSYAQTCKVHDSLILYSPRLLEVPKVHKKDTIIFHEAYSFLYNEKHEQADWVAYELTKDETMKSFERSNKFLTDPAVGSGTATNV